MRSSGVDVAGKRFVYVSASSYNALGFVKLLGYCDTVGLVVPLWANSVISVRGIVLPVILRSMLVTHK